MSDGLSRTYAELLDGVYDSLDRIVLNAYFRFAQNPAGFRVWWRQLHGTEDHLDNAHLMRLAGRFRPGGQPRAGWQSAGQGQGVRRRLSPAGASHSAHHASARYVKAPFGRGGAVAVEEQYLIDRLIPSSKFDVLVQFGNLHPEYGGIFGTRTPGMTGRALVAELSPDEFIVMGFEAHVQFRPTRGSKTQNAQLLRVEEGTFENGEWRADGVLNGDQTFFTVNLPS